MTDEQPSKRWTLWVRYRRDFWLFCVTGAVLLGFNSISDQGEQTERLAKESAKLSLQNKRNIAQMERDRLVARDQSCAAQEDQERLAHLQIIRTYDFLEDLPQAERGTFLIRAIVSGLNDQYDEALAATAPQFCKESRRQRPDDPTPAIVGLDDDTIPGLPARKDFSDLAQPQQ